MDNILGSNYDQKSHNQLYCCQYGHYQLTQYNTIRYDNRLFQLDRTQAVQ